MRLYITLGLLAGAALAAVPLMKYELEQYDPNPNPASVVVSADGLARFTVLTPRLIRMEYTTQKNSFEDRPSLAFVNRNTPKVDFKTAGSSPLIIQTQDLKLTYTGGEFTADSLKVESSDVKSAFKQWDASMFSHQDPLNLLGTFRTLDGQNADSLNCSTNQQPHCEFGIISRAGWALVDDSQTPVLDENDWWTDATTKKTYARNSQVDWYLFAHGHDYVGALKDLTLVGGHIPVTPRYTSGIWFTRWYNINSFDFKKLVYDHVSRSIPLDVFIWDMNWHTKNGWTGYSWDKNILPNAKDTLSWYKQEGLRFAANLHDADGINSWEDQFQAACKALDFNSSASSIPFSVVDEKYATTLEDVVLKPLEDDGIDFWWIDWQQGESGPGGSTGGKMNPTMFTNKLRSTDHKRRGENVRPLVLARFGGLGNHRYQVGFSGDVAALTWSNLAYQPYFSMTASNVGYGFWSHDIEGPNNAEDPEMYVRWLQWGAFSGVMRSHDRGMSSGGCKDPFPTDDQDRCSIVEIWNTPKKYFEAHRDALQLRARLIPYIYTQVRHAYDTGVSLIRPLYYSYPEEDMAYASDQDGKFAQYMFGEDVLVSPVVVKSNETSTLAESSTWLPPASWVDLLTFSVRQGSSNTVLTKKYHLAEIPMFVKVGTILPLKPLRIDQMLAQARRQYDHLQFVAFSPFEVSSGSTEVYEDDGETLNYLNGDLSWTTASFDVQGNDLTFTIKTSGSFPELPQKKSVTIVLTNTVPPSGVKIQGKDVPYSRFGGPGTWTYDGAELSIVIETEEGALGHEDKLAVEVTNAFDATLKDAINGLKGVIARAIAAKSSLDEVHQTPGSNIVQPAHVSVLASLADELSIAAGSDLSKFKDLVQSAKSLVSEAVEEIQAIQHIDSNRQAYAVELLQDALL
jgi:alpha-glucosidase (family GH31 glycosyl hydrolase)